MNSDAKRAFDLTSFELADMTRLGDELRRRCDRQLPLGQTAQRIVEYLHESLQSSDGSRQTALVRFYKTHPFGKLPGAEQEFARRFARESDLTKRTKCLTLLGTAGTESDWNDRRRSQGHRAIPLISVEMVERAPMIAQLLREFGIAIADLLSPAPDLIERLQASTYNVFHVEDAPGSPYIPAQEEFVRRYGIRSVIGFGGSLASGDVFAIIVFARVPVHRIHARRFRNVALELKTELLRHSVEPLFA